MKYKIGVELENIGFAQNSVFSGITNFALKPKPSDCTDKKSLDSQTRVELKPSVADTSSITILSSDSLGEHEL